MIPSPFFPSVCPHRPRIFGGAHTLYQARRYFPSRLCYSVLLLLNFLNFCHDLQNDKCITGCLEMDSRLRGNDIYLCLYSCDSALIRVIRDPRFFIFWLRLCSAVLLMFNFLNFRRDFYEHYRTTHFLQWIPAPSTKLRTGSAGMTKEKCSFVLFVVSKSVQIRANPWLKSFSFFRLVSFWLCFPVL